MLLQQCLPFTVLKPLCSIHEERKSWIVATVLTVYGIETLKTMLLKLLRFVFSVATVLTVYGIETYTSANSL